MTGNVENTTPTGAPQQPTGSASGTGDGSSAITEEKLLMALESKIDGLIERKLQGQKDKRVAGLQGKLDDFESQLARLQELKAEGYNEVQAKRVMRLEDAVSNRDPGQTEAQRPGSPTAQLANLDPSVIELMGLDVNSPEVTNVLRTAADPMGQLQALVNVAKARRQAAQPNPAQQATTASGTSATETYETLSAELQELLRQPSSKNLNKIVEVNAKLAKLRG